MLVILNKLVEEYSDRLVINCNDAYLYDIPESIIKKEILKGNVYTLPNRTESSVFRFNNNGLDCVEYALESPDKIFTGKREIYIEPYLLSGYVNQTLMSYIKTITTGDHPDIEHLIYEYESCVIIYALMVERRMPMFERYVQESHSDSLLNNPSHLMTLYEDKFNVRLTHGESI